MSQTIASYLDECYGLYFKPLISVLSLAGLRREIQGMGGLYEAHGRNTAVRLVNDRGCTNFDVYCFLEPSLCWCGVELLSELLEPPPKDERVVRRLDLESQADFSLLPVYAAGC